MACGFNTSDIRYWLALKFVPRLAVHKKRALVERFGLVELFNLSSEKLKALSLTEKQVVTILSPDWHRVDAVIASCKRLSVAIVGFDQHDYPKLLKEIYDPPLVLFVKGNAQLLNLPQLAIVGSRSSSVNGRESANSLAQQLSSELVITSGLASGIDASAHRGALVANNATIAVVGTGLDQVYPARNKSLARDIIKQKGAIISEFLPGTQPRAGNFPRRNRIISGMSLGVLVIEAAMKSGSLITARCALEQNREVFALPGSPNNPMAKGCHHLIKQGAKLIDCSADIYNELGISLPSEHGYCESEKNVKNNQQGLLNDSLLASVGYEITPVDAVVSRSKLPIDEVLTRLTILELRGLVSAVPGGYLRMNKG